MKTRQYESVVILNAALEEPQIESALGRVRETISSNGGEINDFENWGRKRLAYPIRKAKTGYYAIFRYLAPGEAIAKIERMFRLDEDVFRFLTVTLDKEALAAIAKKKADKEKQQKEDEERARLEKENAEAKAKAEAEEAAEETVEATVDEEEVKEEDTETAPESNDDDNN